MSIRKPTSNLAAPNSVVLAKGTRIERVHDSNYGANAFNPCKGGPTRFAPIRDSSGNCVPSHYGGETLEAVIHETIFHDVPAKAKRKTVRRADVVNRTHSTLEVTRDLNLASLRAPDLKKWRIRRNDLITTSPKLYPGTAAWAEAIHHQFPNIEGLAWTSNQCDPDTVYLFFGDRVSVGDLVILSARDGQTDPSFLTDVRVAGQRSEIRITV